MAEALAGAGASAIAISSASSAATAVASAVATATAGIAIGFGYASGQAINQATGIIRDTTNSLLGIAKDLLTHYAKLITEKPEVGLTGTLLALYLMA